MHQFQVPGSKFCLIFIYKFWYWWYFLATRDDSLFSLSLSLSLSLSIFSLLSQQAVSEPKIFSHFLPQNHSSFYSYSNNMMFFLVPRPLTLLLSSYASSSSSSFMWIESRQIQSNPIQSPMLVPKWYAMAYSPWMNEWMNWETEKWGEIGKISTILRFICILYANLIWIYKLSIYEHVQQSAYVSSVPIQSNPFQTRLDQTKSTQTQAKDSNGPNYVPTEENCNVYFYSNYSAVETVPNFLFLNHSLLPFNLQYILYVF